MFAKTCLWLIGCLIIVSTGFAAGSYDWPGELDTGTLHNAQLQEQSTRGALAGWQGVWNDEHSTPLTAYGPPLALVSPQADDETRQAQAHAFLLQMAALFGEPNVNLELLKNQDVLGKWKALFQETRDGKPVLSSRGDITLNSRGEVMRWGLRTYSTWPMLSEANLSLDIAGRNLQDKIGQQDWSVSPHESFAAFFPDRAQQGLRPVWWIRLAGQAPHARWEGIVDAATGDVLLDWPGIQNELVSGVMQGQFWYPYNSSPTDTAAFTQESVLINDIEVFSDMDGTFSRDITGDAFLVTRLEGPFCNIANEDTDDAEMELALEPPFVPFSWTWSSETAERVEMNAYYHTRFIHQWYKVIDPGFTGLDYSMPVTVNYGTNYDNAFWNGVGCYYGSGGTTFENLAMYCDVIYHEYTHGVTGRIYQGFPLPYSGQSGAMNEAWSDYFPCTITDEPLIGEGGLFNGSPNRYMRNLYNDMHFPENWQGEVHRDSPFISGSLWRIRLALGADIADSLAHYSRYGHADNFFDYLVEVLETDDDDGDLSNGTPHSQTIYTCFGHHGIGPGLDPNFTLQNLNWYENGIGGSSGDGDGWPEVNERVEMTFQLYNEVILFPPPAENVVLTVTSSNPDLTIINGEQNLGDVEPNAVVTPAPIHFDVAPAALDRWATIAITITAENTSRVFEYEVTIPIGYPKVLLVKDDPTSDVESYVVNALHDIDVLFDEIELSEHESLPDSILPEPGLVIWLSGNLRESALTTNDQYLIPEYLSRGNRVILSGQDFIDELSGYPFAQDVLEMEVAQDSFRIASLRPTPGSPLGEENTFILTGTAGASNQDRISILSPLGDNTALCGYGVQGDYGIAGLDFYHGQGIVFGFGMEAISGMANSEPLGVFLQELFQNWASDILTVEPKIAETPVPTAMTLGAAYPNPFNAAVTLPYSIPMGSDAELVIFDLLGREVTRIDLPHQQGSIHWTATGSSGIYFAQIRGEKMSSSITKLILLK